MKHGRPRSIVPLKPSTEPMVEKKRRLVVRINESHAHLVYTGALEVRCPIRHQFVSNSETCATDEVGADVLWTNSKRDDVSNHVIRHAPLRTVGQCSSHR